MAADIKLLHGDCLDLMPSHIADASVDMILADLPFGTTRQTWDKVIDMQRLWREYERVIKPAGAIVLFAKPPFDKVLACSNLPLYRYDWVWEKTRATGHLNANKMPLQAHEYICVFYKQQPEYHPQKTQGHKPVNKFYTRHSAPATARLTRSNPAEGIPTATRAAPTDARLFRPASGCTQTKSLSICWPT